MTIDIEDYLRQFRGRTVVYVPNPGNAGDSVIAAATFQLFDRVGLEYELVRPSRLDAAGRIVIYGGGGNLVSPTSYSHRFVARHHRSAARFVVLPHTIQRVDALVAGLGANVDLICREPKSLQYVRSVGTSAGTYLAHDLAFGLDTGAVLSVAPSRLVPGYGRYLVDRYLRARSVISWRRLLQSRRRQHLLEEARFIAGAGELQCFRTDGESARTQPLPSTNVDLSNLFDFGTDTPEAALLSTRTVLEFLSTFATVRTDRLHMAVSAALLGIDVRFHPNNYFKCRAVHEFSMRGRFPNVRWEEDDTSAVAQPAEHGR